MDQENEAIIEQMVREAEKAAEPGTLKVAQVLSDDDTPAPMVAHELASAGWTRIYDRKTGESSLCNNNMLRQHLRKKWPDGSYVFTVVDPHIKRKLGTLKCLLHPDGPDRKHYDDLGLPTCRKANLTSPFQVTRHMQKRHKQEWETIHSEREEQKEREQREFQKGLLAQMAGTAEAPEKARRGRPPKK